MSHPDVDVLAGVALGEEAGADLQAHLDSCADCRLEVAELASVADAVRADAPLSTPPARVWDAIRTELGSTVGGGFPQSGPPLRAVPDSTPVAPRTPLRPLVGWLAAAAVSGMIVGAGATWIATRPGPAPVVSPLARVDLTTLDTGEVLGEADVRSDAAGITLSLRTQPLDAGEGYLEVWLINRDLNRMVSVGVVPSGGAEFAFPIAQRLLDEGYVVVDISREAFDDRPQHSGDTVARGALGL